MEMTPARSARSLPVLVVLFLSIPFSLAMAAGQADGAMQAPDRGAWFLLIITGIVMMVIAGGILVLVFRLVRAFDENSSSLIRALKVLTPVPDVTQGSLTGLTATSK